ncbi:NADP-dependent oxidoreductase [[Kitasatospora] papulosa]|uniref:Alcohol dehydrogenase GroES domain protein n=3 Tax=Streptomyces TaxID=1883 RepID=A0A8D4BAA4_STRFA|nr:MULTISPECIES: NADP-dependent oxidoreductase [Streptomyces]MDF9868576.1 NADPH:quinone reductase-like Zn-dependent oxidoreductase [Streptomyces pratensis]MCX4416719.1 NADP-dependent oxidoreductase [[Kitasatospora] papulosa]MDF6066019.1 NADP-dependent oxidoreductase [Streptomyces sp. JH010]MYT49436.1 zinc-binding dehydrogenase [Streptomyces sp. SID7815]WKV76716.1 NADP-dependent oxidoreductase [Streptomyces sp. SNU607]
MRAARYHEYGGTDTLVVEQAPDPLPGPGEIRVRVAAAGVNPVDWKVRDGSVRDFLPVDLPAIPGRDAVGLVDMTGEGVTSVDIGDRVFGLGGVTGATAELAVLSAWAPAPAAWSDEEAAGAGLASVTALGGLRALGRLEGRTLLVEGAAGGVGGAAVEIARALGATVIGTASERNHAYLASLGAVPVTYGAGLAERLTGLAPNGVDLVLDAAASGSLPDLVEIAGGPDRVVTVADHVNAERLGVRVANAVNDSALLAEAAALGEQGRYVPRIDRTYPLEEIAQAHAHSERGHVRGKIVILL